MKAAGASVQTLWMAAGNRAALLVTNRAGRRRRRKLRFVDEHAALDWCLARQATFILSPAVAPDPADN